MTAHRSAGLPRHLTRLSLRVTPGGSLHLRLHTAARTTWFLGDSEVGRPEVTGELLAGWALAPRTAIDDAAWWRRSGVEAIVPAGVPSPALWAPPSSLDHLFTAAFVERGPSPTAAHAFGDALAEQVTGFYERSRQAARERLEEGWVDRAQRRLDGLRRVVDPSRQSGAGVLASQVAAELRADGFMELAPDTRARRLFRDLQAERQSLYGWEQALARLGISAPRGSGRYP